MTKKILQSPYLDARREWNERYGDYVASAKFARVMAYLATLVAVIAVAGAILIGEEKEVKPYVVQIDNTGLIQSVQPAGNIDKQIANRITKAQLAAFVEKCRDVVLDAQIQRKNVMDVYAYLRRGTPAFTKITDFFQKHDPFERAKKETVFAEIKRILPLKDNAWQVEWIEKVMDRKTGETLKKYNYKVIAYVTVSTPTSEAAIIKNPLGIIINDFNWSKEI